MTALRDLIARHKAGERVGITSVCSAHPLVIEATLKHALAHGAPLVLIEATSNQVNQDGGYTGMTPPAFRDFVLRIAGGVGFPPNAWCWRRPSRPQPMDGSWGCRGDGKGGGNGC